MYRLSHRFTIQFSGQGVKEEEKRQLGERDALSAIFGYIRFRIRRHAWFVTRNAHCSQLPQPLDSETPHPLSAWSTLVSLYFTCSLCFVSGPLDPSSPTIIVAPNPALRVESAGNGSECSAGAMENCSEPTIVKILAIPLLKVARPLIRRKQSQGGRGTTQTQEPNT